MAREKDRSWVPPVWLMVLGGVVVLVYVAIQMTGVFVAAHGPP